MMRSEGVSRRSDRHDARSPSPSRRRGRSPSPRRRARSPSPNRRGVARSPSPRRKGATSHSQVRKAERPSSPIRNGNVSKETHGLEQFSKLNFNKVVKRPSIMRPNSNVEVWQHTMEPIQRPLLKHLNGNQHLSTQACAAFKDILLISLESNSLESNSFHVA